MTEQPEPEWIQAARRAELDRELAAWAGARRRERRQATRRQMSAAEEAVRRYQEAVANL